MKKIALYIALFTASIVQAATYGVVAVVNNERITNFELVERIDMMISAAKAPNTAELRSQLRGRALEQLINEALQIQHAKEKGYEVTEADSRKAIAALEKRNNLGAGGFDAFLKREGVSRRTVLKQIQAQILWNKLVGQRFARRGYVSEAELNEAMEAQKNNPFTYQETVVSTISTPIYYLKELVFPRTGDDRSVATLAKLVAGDLRSGKMKFDEAIATYAKSSGEGGDIGWVVEEKLPAELKEFVKKNKAGSIFGPVQTPKDFRLFQVAQKKTDTRKEPRVVNKKRTYTRDEMETKLRNEKIGQAVEAYMDKIRNQAYIENRL